jgi:ATP-dependent Clp protease ATP-binding subunit ClpA
MSLASARPFTARTYVSLAIARAIAAAYGHADLTGCHVALGFLREGENPAVGALRHAGVPLHTLRRDLEALLPERGHTIVGEPGERAIVHAADAEANSFHPEYIGNEHLLLALLKHADSPTSLVFSRHGFTYESAITHLHAVFRGEP